MKRTGSWVLAIGTFLCVAGYFGWTLLSGTLAAEQSRLHPLPVLNVIFTQLTQAAPPGEWNIPWLSIAVWFSWMIGILGCGALVRSGLHDNTYPLHAAEKYVFNFACGFTLFALIQLFLGLAGITQIPLIPIFFIIALTTLVNSNRRSEILSLPKAAWWQWKNLPTSGRILCITFLVPILMLLVPALTPPAQSDGMRYHLGAVQEYLKLGAIEYLPHNAYSNMPFLVEMHFMGALACNTPEASQLMHLTLALFTSLAIYCLCLRLLSTNHFTSNKNYLALLPAALYLGAPMSAVLATWPFTDHGISFFLTTSILAALLCCHPDASWKNQVLLGITTGGLLGTKYTVAPIAIAIILMPTILSRFRNQQTTPSDRISIKHVFLALFIAGTIGSVWYLKNLIFAGNPFYPLLSKWFPGGEWGITNDQFLHARAASKGMGHSLTDLFLLPWNATFRWMQFEAHNPSATILIATLSALCGILFTYRTLKFPQRFFIFVIALFSFGIWFFTYQSNRLLLPTIALALCLTPIEVLSNSRIARRLYIGSVALAIACGFAWAIQWSWVTTGLTPPPLPYVIGTQDARSFRYHSLTYARAFDYLNQHVSPDEKVLLIGEHRIYGADFNALWSDWFDTPVLIQIIRQNNITNTNELLDHLQTHNIQWIMINERELEPQLERDFRPWFKPREWQIFEELRQLSNPNTDTIKLPPGVTIHHITDTPQ